MSVAKKTPVAKAVKAPKRLRPATADEISLQSEFHAAKASAAPFIAAQDAAKALLVESMKDGDWDGITVDGVEIAGMDTVNGKDLDWAGLVAAFPGAVAFMGTKTSKRFNAKNPVAVAVAVVA